MSGQTRLPYASPVNIYRFCRVLLKANPTDRFTQLGLEQKGIGQKKQVRTLIEFLGLLQPGPSRSLRREVLAAVNNREEMHRIIRGKVIQSLVETGCEEQELSFFGLDDLTHDDLTAKLQDLLPIDTHDTSTQKSSILGCFRALHGALLNLEDGWLKRQIRILNEQNGTASDAKSKRSGYTRKKGATRGQQAAPDTTRADPGLSEDLPLAPAPLSRAGAETNVTIAHTASFAVGGEVDAHVYFELPPNRTYKPEHLVRLARKLETMAELMRDVQSPAMPSER
jgi:hypothetical protein